MTNPDAVSDAMADEAQKAFHEFAFGPDPDFLTPRRLGISRQAWKVAIAAAISVGEAAPDA